MVIGNQLVGMVLEGYSQIGPRGSEQIGNYLRLLADVKKVHPEMFEGDLAEPNDERMDFQVEILSYNPESRAFVARGRDALGDSGLVGQINDKSITFWKIYSGKLSEKQDVSRQQITLYDGLIEESNVSRVIIMSGDYMVNDVEGPIGRWKLVSQPHD